MSVRFKRKLNIENAARIDIAPLIDCIFHLLIFFMLTSSFVLMQGINVNLPKSSSSEKVEIETLVIAVSSEDIIYLDKKPLTLNEAENFIKKGKYESIFIKADKDASLGTVVEIWDICKKTGVEKIGVGATYQE